MGDDVQRDLGRMEAQLQAQSADIADMKHDIKEMREGFSRMSDDFAAMKGGGRMLMGLAALFGGFITWSLTRLFGGH